MRRARLSISLSPVAVSSLRDSGLSRRELRLGEYRREGIGEVVAQLSHFLAVGAHGVGHSATDR